MLAIMNGLQTLRLGNSVFTGKASLITVRDLMKWANRIGGYVERDKIIEEIGY